MGVACSAVSRTYADVAVGCVDDHHIAAVHLDYDAGMAGAVIAGPGVAELPEGDIAHLRGAADAAAGVVPVEVVVRPTGLGSIAKEYVQACGMEDVPDKRHARAERADEAAVRRQCARAIGVLAGIGACV